MNSNNIVVTPRSNAPTPVRPQNNVGTKKYVIALAIITFMIVVAAIIMITLSKNRNNQDGGVVTNKTDAVVGYTPGNPLPDDNGLDSDQSLKYSEMLKLYSTLNDKMSYQDLAKTAKNIAPSCVISETNQNLGTVLSADGSERISFLITGEDNDQTAYDYDYSKSFTDDDVAFIGNADEGQYKFEANTLQGIYSSKNRAINAYLYYLDRRAELTEGQN